MRALISIVAAVVLAYAAFLVLLYFLQPRFVYFPLRTIEMTPAARGLRYEQVRIRTDDGVTLRGWFVPAEAARATVLFLHGNAGNISHRLDSLAIFGQLRLSTFIIDYRGYGESEGHPTEQGTYRDAVAAWRYLVEQRKISPDRIVLFGRSLGGAVAAWLAVRQTPAALIVESTFVSAPDFAAELYPWLPVRLIARFDYNTAQSLRQVKCPVLVVHSRSDDIVPFAHGRRLFEAANPPKQFLEIDGGHNDGFLLSKDAYIAGMDRFLVEYVGG